MLHSSVMTEPIQDTADIETLFMQASELSRLGVELDEKLLFGQKMSEIFTNFEGADKDFNVTRCSASSVNYVLQQAKNLEQLLKPRMIFEPQAYSKGITDENGNLKELDPDSISQYITSSGRDLVEVHVSHP